MKPVTDPDLLRALEGEAPAAPPGLKPVTDPTLLRMLESGSKNKEKGAELPTDVKAIGSTLQGATLGFSDELSGAIGATVGQGLKLIPDAVAQRVLSPGLQRARERPFSENYAGIRDQMRGAQESFATENPWTNTGLQVVGGLATGGALASAGKQGTARVAPAVAERAANLGPVARAAISGAAFGGVGGAGNAESVGDLATDVPFGMLTGAAGGAASQVAGNVAGTIGSQMTARLPDSVTRRAPFLPPNAEEQARRRIAEAMARDGKTAEQIAARLKTLGPDAPLAVAGGKNTRDLLDTMATMPGRTGDDVEKFIRGQQAGRAGRLIQAAEQGLGTNGMRLSQTLQGLDDMRSKAAGPIYEQLRSVPVTVDDDLARLLERARPAFADAERLAKLRGVPFELPEAIKVAAAARKTPVNTSNMLTEKAAPPTVRLGQLDTLKRTLYDLEQANINPETGRLNEIGNALKDLRRAIVQKADDATRDNTGRSLYEAARNIYAGPSELRAAANLGSQVVTKPGWKIDALTDGMGDAELQAFRIGAMESLREKLGREGGQTELLKMWKEPATQERLKAIFPNERAFRDFAAEVAREARKKSIESVGRGSQTAARQARMEDEGAAALSGAIDLGAAVKTGNPISLIGTARDLYGRASTPEPVRDQIGRILLSNRQQAPAELASLSDLVRQVQAQRSAQATRAGVGGSTLLRDLLMQP